MGPASSALLWAGGVEGAVPSSRDTWDSTRPMERGGGKDPGIRLTRVALSRVVSLTACAGGILEA